MRSLEDLIADFSRFVEGEAPRSTAGSPPAAPVSAGNRAPAPKDAAALSRDRARTANPGAHSAVTESSVLTAAAVPVAAPESARQEAEGGTLLARIAAAVQKDSLQPLLNSVAGARLEGESVILDMGPSANEFLRKQVKENLTGIAQAASIVTGCAVRVFLDEAPAGTVVPPPRSSNEEDVLDRAKKAPGVQSFLDQFPGPVKAEKLKP
jgi:hypothetical protein